MQRPFGEGKENVKDSRGQRCRRHITVTVICIRRCNNASGSVVVRSRDRATGGRTAPPDVLLVAPALASSLQGCVIEELVLAAAGGDGLAVREELRRVIWLLSSCNDLS